MATFRDLVRSRGAWIAAAALGGLVALGLVRARGPEVATVLVTRRDLVQELGVSGRVWVPTRVQVAAQTQGLVVAVPAREGSLVHTGDLLVQIDDTEARAAVGQARAAVEQASARVEQLRRVGAIVATEALRQAETKLERAEGDLQRVKKLAASDLAAKRELDEAVRAVDLAHAEQTAAAAQQLSSAPGGADTRVVLTALLQAQAQLNAATARLAHTRVLALQDGVVLTRNVEPGEVVQPSRTLLVLAAGGDVAQLVFQCDERNLASIALGQKARASADAYPRDVFDAEVSFIAPSVDPQRGSVEVRLRITKPPSFLKPDMTVSIDLAIAQGTGVLTVPSGAVRGAAGPRPWLLVVEDGRVARREVALGMRGAGTVEITEGVAEGASVILPDGRQPVVGQRVRAVQEDL